MRFFLLALFCGIASLSAQAQDTILRTDGEEIKARVLLITPTELSYVPATDPPSSDTLYIVAAEVFLVRFANGTKAIVTAPATMPPAVGLGRTAQQMNALGREDARKYFRAPGVFWGTAGATFIGLYTAGIPGIAIGAASAAIAASPPKRHNMINADQTLLNDPNYFAGYRKQAQQKKLGGAIGGIGTSVAVITVFVVAVRMGFFGAH